MVYGGVYSYQNEGRRMILQDVPMQSLRYNIQCCTLYCNATNEASNRMPPLSPRLLHFSPNACNLDC